VNKGNCRWCQGRGKDLEKLWNEAEAGDRQSEKHFRTGKGKELTGNEHEIRRLWTGSSNAPEERRAGPRLRKGKLVFFSRVRFVALFADFVFLGGLFAAGMRAVFA
jgi:hypothetical protein